MEKYLKFMRNKIFKALMVFVFGFMVLSPVLVSADAASDAKAGLSSAGQEAYGESEANLNSNDIPTMIGKVVAAILQFVGVIFFVLMIYGGLRWMTARGNEQDVQKAKDTIEAAAIGIVIVLAAYAITMFIGTNLT